MGRKRLNRTKKEIRKQNRIRAKRFYDRHKNKVKQRNLQRYYEKVGKKMSDL